MKSKKIIAGVLVSSIVLTNSYSFASDIVGSTSNVIKNEDGSVTIITQNKKLVKKYTSTSSATTKNNFRVTADANFIEDERSAEATTIVTIGGFIPSGRKVFGLNNDRGVMQWPVKYGVEVENISEKKNVRIVDNVPKNTIESKEVNESLSYSVGGGIDTSKNASLNSNVAFSKVIKYTQPDYITLQRSGTNNNVSWDTKFAETRDQYSLDSWNPIYGNQMFMNSRYSGTCTTNFTPDYKLSSLITGGFSPNFGIVLSTPTTKETKSRIKVKFKREMLSYHMVWYTAWRGENYPDRTIVDEVTFEIDWQNRTIKQVSEE